MNVLAFVLMGLQARLIFERLSPEQRWGSLVFGLSGGENPKLPAYRLVVRFNSTRETVIVDLHSLSSLICNLYWSPIVRPLYFRHASVVDGHINRSAADFDSGCDLSMSGNPHSSRHIS